MALEGTIRDFGLPDIFQLIGLQRKSGTLTLTNEKDNESVTITFEGGMVVMADSSAGRLEDRLGHVLVKQGKLTRERLEEALATQKATLQRLGHILLSASAITDKDLRDALQGQVSQIVFRIFRWRDGRYQFTASDSVDYDREHIAPMSADFILMEGVRMVDEWPIIEKKIPSFDMVLRPVVDPSLIDVGIGAGVDGSDAERRSAVSGTGRIRVAPDEEKVFRKVDGVRTVQAIIDGSGISEFEVCRILFDFLNRNLIAPAGRGRVQELEEVQAGVASSVPGYVVAILALALVASGLVVQRGSPFAVTGLQAALGGTYDMAIEEETRSRLARLELAIEAWQANHGSPPTTLEDLANTGLVDRGYLYDAWKRPFHYEPGARGFLLSAVDESGRSRPDATVDRRASDQ
jgi:hypothetical protein